MSTQHHVVIDHTNTTIGSFSGRPWSRSPGAWTDVRDTHLDNQRRSCASGDDSARAVELLDLPAARAFAEAVRAVELDDEARVVLLTGAGKRFSAGGDVASIVAAEDRSAYLHQLADVLDGALQRLDSLPKPVVVAVQGAVAGAGIGLMLTATSSSRSVPPSSSRHTPASV